LFVGKLKKRADGRYMKWVTLQDGSRKAVYASSEPELNKKIKELLSDDEKGIDVDDKSTVRGWAEKLVTEYNVKLRPTTQSNYCNMLNGHILPVKGEMPLKAVRPVNIQSVMNKISNKSESLQNHVYRTMHRLFETAVINRLIVLNPCKGIKITPRSDIEDNVNKLRALSAAQREVLLKAIESTRAELFVNIGLWCGLRREETLGLRWGDIDFKAETLTVQRTVTFTCNEAILSDKMKSKTSRRTIPIPPPLMALFECENPEHKGTVKIIRHHKKKPDEIILSAFICHGAAGNVMTQSAFDRLWEVVTNAVDFDITSHMLRHTYCTWLYDNGIDLKTAQYLMEHSDIRMTANIYTQIGSDQVQSASQKIKSIFACSQSCSQTANADDSGQK
jgi:integrase